MDSSRNPLPTNATDSDALTFLKASLPSFQGSGERILADHKALIPAAIRAAKSQLWPAAPEQITLALKRLVDFADAFNIPSEKLKSAIGIYADALKHLPPDLIEHAVTAAMGAHKWGMRLPLPAELIAHVSGEMSERRSVLGKLEIMDRAGVEALRDHAAPSPEEIAKVDAVLADWRRKRGPDPRTVVNYDDDDRPPPNDKNAFYVEPNLAILDQVKELLREERKPALDPEAQRLADVLGAG